MLLLVMRLQSVQEAHGRHAMKHAKHATVKTRARLSIGVGGPAWVRRRRIANYQNVKRKERKLLGLV